jgi:hypothetical protein
MIVFQSSLRDFALTAIVYPALKRIAHEAVMRQPSPAIV